MITRSIFTLLALLLSVALSVVQPAWAESQSSPGIADVDTLRDGLRIKNTESPVGGKTRGWGAPDRGVTVQGGTPVPAPSMQLHQINFEYNSAQLTTDARLTLDNLAKLLSEAEFRNARFKLTGHTDGIGGAAYNQKLSEQRAQSAKTYLLQRHQLDPARLDTEGKGYSELIDKADRGNAINRRVQVTNLGAP